MTKCSECGLLEKRSESFYCHRFDKGRTREEFNAAQDCLYFCQQIYEDGELLTPQQHLIMQNNQLKSKRMRGPV
ncbi:MAG: hypothetical protein Q7J85_08135 [Bacillota bacterium]|nr:hypothetical protein [Bacillota bacterium]